MPFGAQCFFIKWKNKNPTVPKIPIKKRSKYHAAVVITENKTRLLAEIQDDKTRFRNDPVQVRPDA